MGHRPTGYLEQTNSWGALRVILLQITRGATEHATCRSKSDGDESPYRYSQPPILPRCSFVLSLRSAPILVRVSPVAFLSDQDQCAHWWRHRQENNCSGRGTVRRQIGPPEPVRNGGCPEETGVVV